MFPYFEHTTIAIGPIPVSLWGLFIALGVVVMVFVARSEVARYRISFDALVDLIIWSFIAALVGARLSHVFLYEPALYLAQPSEIFRVWNGGMSSLGGMIFGTAAALFFIKQKKLDLRAVGDVLFRTMPFAWAIGRMGCYVTHLHPGKITPSVFGVAYPDAVRWDLGLLESFVWMVIALIVWLAPRARVSGAYIVIVPLIYAPLRFALDFLRIEDTRYAYLTPAQYGMVILFIIAVTLGIRWNVSKKV